MKIHKITDPNEQVEAVFGLRFMCERCCTWLEATPEDVEAELFVTGVELSIPSCWHLFGCPVCHTEYSLVVEGVNI